MAFSWVSIVVYVVAIPLFAFSLLLHLRKKLLVRRYFGVLQFPLSFISSRACAAALHHCQRVTVWKKYGFLVSSAACRGCKKVLTTLAALLALSANSMMVTITSEGFGGGKW